jgi:ubiquinone/menaquinone biosynthesis C-methylase UbiE
MAKGRRAASLADPSAWVFNRIAGVYDARPAYPPALIDALCALGGAGCRAGDLGAGTGHVALPLAARGFEVIAIEPAQAMLDALRARAAREGVAVQALLGTAEAMPIAAQSLDLVVIADALHFLDAELTALEIARVLSPGGAVAIVTSELGDTPFMRGVARAMDEAAPRRARDTRGAVTQLAALARAPLGAVQRFDDAHAVDDAALERILRSISFIGPAMNAQRFEAFRARVHAVPGPKVWSRSFTLRSGRRR